MQKELLQNGFCRIKKEDVLKLKKYYQDMEAPYASSIDLVSIFSWDRNLPAYYKDIYGYLCFVVYDKINLRWVSLPPVGKYAHETLKIVFCELELFFRETNHELIFTDVTPWMVIYFQEFFQKRMEILDQEELREYIYSYDDFRKKLEDQRERYNYQYFLKKHQIEVKELTEDLEEDCQRVLKESFCELHSCEECEYGCLKDTLHYALLLSGSSEMFGFLIYADNNPIAYNIVSEENNQMVFHFKKNIRGFRGMNEFIHKETLERYGKDCTSINYTEDMGVEGLRKYKMNLCNFTYQPKLEIKVK